MPKIVLQNSPSGVPPEIEVMEEAKIGARALSTSARTVGSPSRSITSRIPTRRSCFST